MEYSADTTQYYKVDEIPIDPSIIAYLKNTNIKFIEQIADLTIIELIEIIGLSEKTCKQIFFKIDLLLDQKFYPRPLCSNLPFKFYNLSIDFLDLPLNAYKHLKESSIETLGQLAKMTFEEVNFLPNMTHILTLEIEFILSRFIDDYRNGNVAIQAILEMEGLTSDLHLKKRQKEYDTLITDELFTPHDEKTESPAITEEEFLKYAVVEKKVAAITEEATDEFFTPQEFTSELPSLTEEKMVEYVPDEKEEENFQNLFFDSDEITKYQIDETGEVLGIKLGETAKEAVLKNIGKPERMKDNVFYYDNLGIAVYFNEIEIIEEILITAPYFGTTKNGIAIGDSMDRVYEIYGNPIIRQTDNTAVAVWRNISIASDSDYKVREIRLSMQ